MVSVEQNKNELIVSYINKEGIIDFKRFKIPESELFEWVYSSKDCDPIVRSWDDKKVRKKSTNTLNSYRIAEFLMTIPQRDQDEIFENNIPKKYFCDIETEILDVFPDPENPKSAIQTIAIANDKDLIMVLGTREITKEIQDSIQIKLNSYFEKFNKNITFKYMYFQSEYDMLYSFFNRAIKNIPFLTGWNFIDFDWAYLVGRATFLNIDVSVASPTKKFTKDNLPLHKLVVDYMEVYRKWDRIVQMKDFNSLDFVASAALNVKKIKYNGSLTDLYNNDYEGFVYYNAVDSYLVKLIDEKLNTLVPFFTLAHLTSCEQNRVFSPVHMVENIMIQQLWKDKKRVFVKTFDKNVKTEKYAGAFVMEPIVGFHNYLATFDYSSEYPTNIRQWNLSPDVFIKKDKNFKVTSETITTASGAVFRKNEDGVLKTLLTDLFNRRVKAKHTAGEVETEINYLETIIKNK